MSNDKKLVEEITPMDVDFARWYTDIVKKADLIEYTSIKGCCVFRPYAYALWENIQQVLNSKFKETSIEKIHACVFEDQFREMNMKKKKQTNSEFVEKVIFLLCA